MTLLPMVGHVREEDVPWVWIDKVGLQVLRVNADTGVWVVRNRFKPGAVVQRHRHTGPVHGFTIAGRWRYAEYGIDYTAGTFIFEPANSVHTLTVPEENTELTDVVFVMEGANLNLAEDGSVESVTDGSSTLAAYQKLCEAQGFEPPSGVLG
ncbi:2,4'-dihydroxyacetophenone dioxygenase family protein [Catenulispora subtropica]|uniref:ChrR-like cupin domain-containing protein n=1 Tax=Catenulispora subtropica TaxID=450798 RepID=A0ABP5D548_9ACTN